MNERRQGVLGKIEEEYADRCQARRRQDRDAARIWRSGREAVLGSVKVHRCWGCEAAEFNWEFAASPGVIGSAAGNSNVVVATTRKTAGLVAACSLVAKTVGRQLHGAGVSSSPNKEPACVGWSSRKQKQTAAVGGAAER
ncbi:hypothetical protein NL676_022322 [Syzygium grande]|nr:hypothetical protein NL676_022322 [Syzygium grande]